MWPATGRHGCWECLDVAAIAAAAAADAKPAFIRPYTGAGHPDPSTLPLLLYVPGIDGTGMAASRQFPELVQAFDLRAFSVPISDRTPFEGLVDLLE